MLLSHQHAKWISLISIWLLMMGTLLSAQAAVYPMPTGGNTMIGETVVVKPERGDTLLTIGNRYDIGMHEMLEANPDLHLNQDSSYLPLRRGSKVIVPAAFILPSIHKGIIINLPELRIFYFTPDGKYVYTYPVGLGRLDWRTPLTQTTVINKKTDPTWTVPKSIHDHVLEETGEELPSKIEPGPDNPLGRYALYLGTSGYLIHGTNQPWSIGKYVSSGCIRLHNPDIEELFNLVKVGTPVYIVNFANKAGWDHGQLYLEAHIPLEMDDAPIGRFNPGSVDTVITAANKSHPVTVDWEAVNKVVAEHTGVPQPVGGVRTRQLNRENKHTAPIYEQDSTKMDSIWNNWDKNG